MSDNNTGEDKKISSFSFKDLNTEDLTPEAREALNSAAANAAKEAMEKFSVSTQQIAAALEKAQSGVFAKMAETAQAAAHSYSKAIEGLRIQIEQLQEYRETILQEYGEMGLILLIGDYADNPNIQKFVPYTSRVFDAYKEKNNLSLSDVMKEKDPDTGEKIFYSILRQAAREAEATGDSEAIAGVKLILEDDGVSYSDFMGLQLFTEPETRAINGRRVKDLDYPIDKVNFAIWDLLKTAEVNGQISFPIKAEPNKKSRKEVNLMYSINFEAIEEMERGTIIKRLTQWDKREYIAIGALYDAGNTVVSLTQIYHAMGYTGNPGKGERTKLNNGLTKYHAIITLDNLQEIKAGYKYPKFVYDGALLPFERVSNYEINGQLIESAIHILAEPPLLRFARERKQITSVPLIMLQSPVNKTEFNLAIEDYLIERIARARNSTQPKRILFSTIYEHIGIKNGTTEKEKNTAKAQRKRAKKAIITLLDYYIKAEQITSYETDKTGITLVF